MEMFLNSAMDLELSTISHIIEDNVMILNLIKQKYADQKNTRKINKES